MPDEITTLTDLRARVAEFITERQWETYHTPKSLSMSIAIEAAELMEQFQWVGNERSRQTGSTEPVRSAATDELADVLIYCLALANALDVDVSQAVQAKLARNRQRFPPGPRCVPSRYRLEPPSGDD